MIFDTLTITGYFVFFFTLFLIFGAMYYSHITMKKNMKILARNAILMSGDEDLRYLCERVMEKNPNACPLLDGDASNPYISDPEHLKTMLRKQLDDA